MITFSSQTLRTERTRQRLHYIKIDAHTTHRDKSGVPRGNYAIEIDERVSERLMQFVGRTFFLRRSFAEVLTIEPEMNVTATESTMKTKHRTDDNFCFYLFSAVSLAAIHIYVDFIHSMQCRELQLFRTRCIVNQREATTTTTKSGIKV